MTPGVWLVTALALVLAEILSVNFVFASFALAALVAAAAAGLHLTPAFEFAVFAVAAVLSLALLRPAVLRRLYRRGDAGPTGVAKLVGRSATVTAEVSATRGSLTIDGDTWSARCDSGVIAPGSTVVIVDIAGAIALVRPAGQE